MIKRAFLLLSFLIAQQVCAQDISLLKQFNGHVNFTMFGNTLNSTENEGNPVHCTILTSSTSALSLHENDKIEAAYLYWAGSGSGDFNIKLNNQTITPDRTFTNYWYQFEFFSAFKDITTIIKNTGNTSYTVSDFDLTNVISNYCFYGVNFGGWAVVVIYSNSNLPYNQINVYDGMQGLRPNNVTINLDNLNVITTQGAQIGFLAWEGDSALAVTETLRINGNLIGNTLNPEDNAFNSTNSFTGATDLYNMDLDFYNISNHINVGDTSAIIELTSGQDYVMMNCVVTKMNSILATTILTTIPQAFSPNDDAINDVFEIIGLAQTFPNFKLTIFNRYGNVVFNGNKENPKWNGTYNGSKLPSGTYFYTLYLNDNYFDKIKGWIYLTK